MILLHKHSFGVAEYFRRMDPHLAKEKSSRGLVIPVELVFEEWLDGKPQHAEAFLDPGADKSMLSLRWAHEKAAEAGSPILKPKSTAAGKILEDIEIEIGAVRLTLGDAVHSTYIADQDERALSLPVMPGYEDLLLGRSFITEHEILVIIDGREQGLSLLAPLDEENQRTRERILETLPQESR